MNGEKNMYLNEAIKSLIVDGVSLDDIALQLIDSLHVVIENKEQPLSQLQETKKLIQGLEDKIALANDELQLNVVFDHGAPSEMEVDDVKLRNCPVFDYDDADQKALSQPNCSIALSNNLVRH